MPKKTKTPFDAGLLGPDLLLKWSVRVLSGGKELYSSIMMRDNLNWITSNSFFCHLMQIHSRTLINIIEKLAGLSLTLFCSIWYLRIPASSAKGISQIDFWVRYEIRPFMEFRSCYVYHKFDWPTSERFCLAMYSKSSIALNCYVHWAILVLVKGRAGLQDTSWIR